MNAKLPTVEEYMAAYEEWYRIGGISHNDIANLRYLRYLRLEFERANPTLKRRLMRDISDHLIIYKAARGH